MSRRKNSAPPPNGGNSSEVTVEPETSTPKRAAVRRVTLGFRTARMLPRVVWLFGFASLFNDVSSEAIFPLLPQFLTSLGAPIAFLGPPSRVRRRRASSSVIKMISGRLSDRGPRRLLVTGGYTLPGIARAGIALAAAPWHVLTARLVDRAGKGIRSGPRDAMIADAVDASERGRAFGLNRSMDHLGAAVGPLIASALVALGVGLRATFVVAALLGLVAPALLFLRLREPAPAEAPRTPETAAPGEPRLRRGYTPYLMACVMFALGNSSDAFLIVRAAEVGWKNVPLLWFFHHLVKSAAALPGGALSDRHSRAIVVAAGWAAYALTYVGLGPRRRPCRSSSCSSRTPSTTASPRARAPSSPTSPSAAAAGRAFGIYHGSVGVVALPVPGS